MTPRCPEPGRECFWSMEKIEEYVRGMEAVRQEIRQSNARLRKIEEQLEILNTFRWRMIAVIVALGIGGGVGGNAMFQVAMKMFGG